MPGCKSGTAMALLAALGATQVSAQQVSGCDVDGNGYVSADEAAACAERDYSAMTGDQEPITRERFEQAFPASENVDEMWAEADANQDGQLSQAEWSDWSARRFRSASPRVEGLSVDDFEALEAQYHMGDDQQGRDESLGGDQPGAVGDQSGGSGGDNDGSGDNGDGDTASDGSDSDADGSSGEADASGDSGDDASGGEADASGDSGDDASGGEADASGDSDDDASGGDADTSGGSGDDASGGDADTSGGSGDDASSGGSGSSGSGSGGSGG